MVYEYGRGTHDFFEAFFNFFLKFSLLYFLGIFNKTIIIPLALVGYEMIIANSYPTRACRILLNRHHTSNTIERFASDNIALFLPAVYNSLKHG